MENWTLKLKKCFQFLEKHIVFVITFNHKVSRNKRKAAKTFFAEFFFKAADILAVYRKRSKRTSFLARQFYSCMMYAQNIDVNAKN